MSLRSLCLAVFAACLAPALHAADDGWTILFDGSNLEHWQETTGNWSIEDDGTLLIAPRPGEKGWSRYSSYLYTKKKFADFIISIEYMYPPGGNSGLYFRIGDTKDATQSGLEAQILDSSKKKTVTAHDHGGIIRTAAPSKNMSKQPGEWNHMIVKAVGKHIQVTLNGEQVVDVDISNKPTKDRPASGYIGLQDHGEGNNLRFRNIKIKELTAADSQP
jgi:hypothetical protein